MSFVPAAALADVPDGGAVAGGVARVERARGCLPGSPELRERWTRRAGAVMRLLSAEG